MDDPTKRAQRVASLAARFRMATRAIANAQQLVRPNIPSFPVKKKD